MLIYPFAWMPVYVEARSLRARRGFCVEPWLLRPRRGYQVRRQLRVADYDGRALHLDGFGRHLHQSGRNFQSFRQLFLRDQGHRQVARGKVAQQEVSVFIGLHHARPGRDLDAGQRHKVIVAAAGGPGASLGLAAA